MSEVKWEERFVGICISTNLTPLSRNHFQRIPRRSWRHRCIFRRLSPGRRTPAGDFHLSTDCTFGRFCREVDHWPARWWSDAEYLWLYRRLHLFRWLSPLDFSENFSRRQTQVELCIKKEKTIIQILKTTEIIQNQQKIGRRNDNSDRNAFHTNSNAPNYQSKVM